MQTNSRGNTKKQGDIIIFYSLFLINSERRNGKISFHFFLKAAAPSVSPNPAMMPKWNKSAC